MNRSPGEGEAAADVEEGPGAARHDYRPLHYPSFSPPGKEGDLKERERRGTRHLSEILAAPRQGAPGPPRHARKGLRHLAVLDLETGQGRDRGLFLRSARNRRQARRSHRHRRRQPSQALLDHVRGPGDRRGAGAALPGFRGRGDVLRAGSRRGSLRRGRKPGAGRQAARRARTLPVLGADRLRRHPGAARLQPRLPAFL